MPVAIPLAIAGASAISGAISAHAAKSAAKTQSASADKALALNTRIYDEQKAQMQPFVTGGQQAFQTLLNGWQGKQGMSPGQGMASTPLAPGRPMPNGGPQPGSGQAMFGQAMQPQQQAQRVVLKAPTGETREFQDGDPQIQSLLSRGAQRVS